MVFTQTHRTAFNMHFFNSNILICAPAHSQESLHSLHLTVFRILCSKGTFQLIVGHAHTGQTRPRRAEQRTAIAFEVVLPQGQLLETRPRGVRFARPGP